MNKDEKNFNNREEERRFRNDENHDEEEKSSLEQKVEYDFERIFFNRKTFDFRKLLKSLFK